MTTSTADTDIRNELKAILGVEADEPLTPKMLTTINASIKLSEDALTRVKFSVIHLSSRKEVRDLIRSNKDILPMVQQSKKARIVSSILVAIDYEKEIKLEAKAELDGEFDLLPSAEAGAGAGKFNVLVEGKKIGTYSYSAGTIIGYTIDRFCWDKKTGILGMSREDLWGPELIECYSGTTSKPPKQG